MKAPKVSKADVQRCFDRHFELFVWKYNTGAAAPLAERFMAAPERSEERAKLRPMLVLPSYNGGEDGKHFKQMVGEWGVDRVLALLDEMFETSDPAIVRGSYQVRDFYYHRQRLLLASVRGRHDDRTLRNADAVHRSTQRR